MGIPDKLKSLRKELNLKQKQVAESLNITRATYGHYETGHADPPASMLIKLAKFYNITVDELVNNSPHQNEVPTTNDINCESISLSPDKSASVHQKALHIKAAILNIVGLAFDGEPEDEETLKLVIRAMEEGASLAKEESKKKYILKK